MEKDKVVIKPKTVQQIAMKHNATLIVLKDGRVWMHFVGERK